MAWRFNNGATSHGAQVTTALSAGGDNSCHLICGWWKPEVLTATRKYWGFGQTYGAEVDSTTSEIRMRTDNTTDGQWLTSGAGITAGNWHFIAWLSVTENTTVAGQWRVWVGTVDQPPLPITVTNPTSRSGNYTGSTTFTIANESLASNGLDCTFGYAISLVTTAVGMNQWSTIATSGALNTAEEENIYKRWVLPIWNDEFFLNAFKPNTLSGSFSLVYINCEVTIPYAVQYSQSQTAARPAVNLLGSPTITDEHCPGTFDEFYCVGKHILNRHNR